MLPTLLVHHTQTCLWACGYQHHADYILSVRVAAARASPQGDVELAVTRGPGRSATRRRRLVAALQEPEPNTTQEWRGQYFFED